MQNIQNIRTIGGAGGIFHILVPGVFLLLNLIACIYIFPFTPTETREHITQVLSNPAMGLLIILGFGYLIGVILRIFRSEYADLWSAKFLRTFDPNARPPKRKGNHYAYGSLPYTTWMEQVCLELPEDVQKFYQDVWAGQNSQNFLNFIKIMVISEDERAANEIYAAESLCRYISGMFYALIASGVLSIVTLTFQVITWIWIFDPKAQNPDMNMTPNVILCILLLGYLAALVGILKNYRFMRIKEVKTVFFSAYKNRHLFL